MKEKIELVTKNLYKIKREYLALYYKISGIFIEDIKDGNMNTFMFEEIFNELSLISNRTIFTGSDEESFVSSRLDEILRLLKSFHEFNCSTVYLLNAENENYNKLYKQNYENQTLDFLYTIANEFNYIDLVNTENKVGVLKKFKDIESKRLNLLKEDMSFLRNSLAGFELINGTLCKKISYLTEQIHEINENLYLKNSVRKIKRRKSSYYGIKVTRCPIERSANLLPYQRNSPSIKEDFRTF